MQSAVESTHARAPLRADSVARRMPTRNTSTRGRHTCSPPDQYALSNLKPPDINHYDVFTLASPYFWQRPQAAHHIASFITSSRGSFCRLLVSRRTSHCDRATKLGFKCVTSCHHPHDAMLSKGRSGMCSGTFSALARR